nr:hypothetical protein [Rhizobium smilacinae]
MPLLTILQLDPDSFRAVDKYLADARAGYLIVFDPEACCGRSFDRVVTVEKCEGGVVEHSLREIVLALHDIEMDCRVTIEIKPVAGHLEGRSLPLLHSEKRLQEIDHRFRITGMDIDMIQTWHRPLPRFSAKGSTIA